MRWDGLASGGTRVAPGIYLVSLRTSQGVQTRRISVAR
jgi:hypothetical protein